MYSGSTELNTAIAGQSRTFSARITAGETVITSGIKSIKWIGGGNAGGTLTIGSTVAARVEVEMAAPGILLENKEISVEIVVQLESGVEYIPMGRFVVEKPEKSAGNIRFSAHDRMISKGELAYFSDLVYPSDSLKVLEEICGKMGITLATTDLKAIAIPAKPEGYTCREVLGYIAGLYGKFAVVNRTGQLELRWYAAAGTVDFDRADEPEVAEYDFVVGKITCAVDKETTLTAGSGPTGIQCSNPLMTQTVLDAAFKGLNGFAYRPGTVSLRLGDPRIDPWDMLQITRDGESYLFPCMGLTHDFDGGIITEVTAAGVSQTEAEYNYQGPTAQRLDRVYTELLMVRDLVADSVTVEYLQANYANLKDFTAVSGRVGKLEVDLGEFDQIFTEKIDAIEGNFDSLNTDYLVFKNATGESLDVIGATVGDLEAESARVKQLLAGNITADNIHAGAITAGSGIIADGAIGDAQISDLSANKITSGRVDTGKVIVGSQDGHLQIQDNTIQISDGTRIRVQIGRDGVGDYSMTVVDDAGKIMWDSNGMTGDAIKSGIIRDSMVSDDANISGRKLDINSVVTSINGATEKIDQTVIQVGNKSLSVYLAEQSQTITDQEKTLTEQSSKITAMDDEIKLRVDSQTYTQDKEKMESSLTKATSDISILQGQIALKVEQTDIDKSVSTAINTAKAEISVETGKISQSVSEIRTEIQDLKAETNSGLDEIRGTVQTNYTNATQYADKIVLDALTEYVKTGDLESFKETISTQFQQTAEDFTFNFSRLVEQINTMEGESQSQFAELKKYIRFVDGNIVLGEENNPLILTIRNDRIAFTQAGVEVAYFSNSKMYVKKLEVTEAVTLVNLNITLQPGVALNGNII